MAKKKSDSSPHEKRITATEIFKTPLSEASRAGLRRLAALPDSKIDCSDAPEVFPAASEVEYSRFYRPVK